MRAATRASEGDKGESARERLIVLHYPHTFTADQEKLSSGEKAYDDTLERRLKIEHSSKKENHTTAAYASTAEVDAQTPSAIYNAMIHPLAPFSLAGFTWCKLSPQPTSHSDQMRILI